jgi:hypothetical protein
LHRSLDGIEQKARAERQELDPRRELEPSLLSGAFGACDAARRLVAGDDGLPAVDEQFI